MENDVVFYRSLNGYLREQFGEKVYRLALDGGMTCPNRDGKVGHGGCIFCSGGGSGEFAEKVDYTGKVDSAREVELVEMAGDSGKFAEKAGDSGKAELVEFAAKTGDHFEVIEEHAEKENSGSLRSTNPDSIEFTGNRCFHFCSGQVTAQIEAAKLRIRKKTDAGKFIAYFQSFTNTYGPVDYLEKLFTEAISHPEVVVLSVATRPDCLPPEVVELLEKLNRIKPVWVELGLQTMREETARYIRRGYPLSVYEDAVKHLRAAGIQVITHVILGLPGESKEDMIATCRYLAEGPARPDGIKLQLLHVLKGTDLAAEYEAGKFEVLGMEEYIELLVDCVSVLPKDMVIHRLTGDGDKKLLIAPLWSGDKKRVLNAVNRRLKVLGEREN